MIFLEYIGSRASLSAEYNVIKRVKSYKSSICSFFYFSKVCPNEFKSTEKVIVSLLYSYLSYNYE